MEGSKLIRYCLIYSVWKLLSRHHERLVPSRPSPLLALNPLRRLHHHHHHIHHRTSLKVITIITLLSTTTTIISRATIKSVHDLRHLGITGAHPHPIILQPRGWKPSKQTFEDRKRSLNILTKEVRLRQVHSMCCSRVITERLEDRIFKHYLRTCSFSDISRSRSAASPGLPEASTTNSPSPVTAHPETSLNDNRNSPFASLEPDYKFETGYEQDQPQDLTPQRLDSCGFWSKWRGVTISLGTGGQVHNLHLHPPPHTYKHSRYGWCSCFLPAFKRRILTPPEKFCAIHFFLVLMPIFFVFQGC